MWLTQKGPAGKAAESVGARQVIGALRLAAGRRHSQLAWGDDSPSSAASSTCSVLKEGLGLEVAWCLALRETGEGRKGVRDPWLLPPGLFVAGTVVCTAAVAAVANTNVAATITTTDST